MLDIQKATAIVVNILAEAKEDVAKIYNFPEAQLLSHRVNSDLDKLINALSFMSGTQPVIGNEQPAKEMFPPITHFMGEKLELRKPITQSDLSPAKEERQAYRNKVHKLYDEIDTLSAEGILNSYTIPEDKDVIRGVAKLAGVEGYEDRTIDESFINDIVKAKAAKIAGDKQQEEIDKQLAEMNSKKVGVDAGNSDSNNPGADAHQDDEDDDDDNLDEDDGFDPFADHELTEEDLTKYPQLAGDGFKAGETVNAMRWAEVTHPIGQKVNNPDVQKTEATATEAKTQPAAIKPAATTAAAATTGPAATDKTTPESNPLSTGSKTITPAASAGAEAKQQEKNTGGKNKGK